MKKIGRVLKKNGGGIGKRMRARRSLRGIKLAVGEEEMVHLSLSDQFVSPS